jgi:hypothetical protein
LKLEDLAVRVIEAAEAAGVEFMAVGAIAAGAYGVPRSTRDVDLLVSVKIPGNVAALIERLGPLVAFDEQVTFDTLTWGRRHVGRSNRNPNCSPAGNDRPRGFFRERYFLSAGGNSH